MVFNINTPSIRINVVKKYLTQNDNDLVLVAGYLMTVKSVDGNALAFTALLDSGAIFANLPIEALRCNKYKFNVTSQAEYTTPQLQPYSCLDGSIQIVEYELLKHSTMLVKVAGQDVEARYLFTIDYNGTSLADDPEQRKTHNIVQLWNNQIAAMPNNKCLVTNKSLTNAQGWPSMYRRINKYYVPES